MARKILVSRNGLTQCPACTSHIRIAADVRETECEFCGASLLAPPTRSTFQRLARAGRSGALAASLFGLAVAGPLGCDSDEESTLPGGDAVEEDASGDAPGTGDVTNSGDVVPVPDTVPVALYGISPTDINEQPDASEAPDMQIDSAADTLPEALYGSVPIDAG